MGATERASQTGRRRPAPVNAHPRTTTDRSAVNPAPAGGPRKIVYLVDDDDALRHALGRLLTSCGYDVRPFGSAEAFLDVHDVEERACVLLDLRMPGRSGLDIQAELARRGSELGIVFLTGHADPRTREIALRQGAVGFLEKPAREPEILAALERALQRG